MLYLITSFDCWLKWHSKLTKAQPIECRVALGISFGIKFTVVRLTGTISSETNKNYELYT